MKKKAVKEIDFSNAKPNKFAGKKLVVIGDPKHRRKPDPADRLFRFFNTRNGRHMDIRALNRKEARLIFLKNFNLERMPAGFEIKEIKEDALKSETKRKKVSKGKPRAAKKKSKPKLPAIVVEDFGGHPYEYIPLGKYIVAARNVCGGRPTIKYHRLDARWIWRFYKGGESMSLLAKEYKIPLAAVKEVIALADKYDYEASYIKSKPWPKKFRKK